MNYRIIQDEEKLDKFIEWLPELEPNEKFYCSLFSRKKYFPSMIKSNDKTQLKRFLATKKTLKNKLRQLECKVGSFQLKEIPAPQESLVVYINPNPRNLVRASYNGAMKLIKMLRDDAQGFNPHAEMMSAIQRSKSRTVWVDFDYDVEHGQLDDVLGHIYLDDIVNLNAVKILKTRGGAHVLVNTNLVEDKYKKSWYNALRGLGADQTGDQMIPVTGCTQGGFIPHFIN